MPSIFDLSGYSKGSTDVPTVCTPQVSARSKRVAKRADKKAAQEILFKVIIVPLTVYNSSVNFKMTV